MQADNLSKFFDIILKDLKNIDLCTEVCKTNLGITIDNHMGCLYQSGKYIVGSVGTQGPANNPPEPENSDPVKPTYTRGLILYLNFDFTANQLYQHFMYLYGKYNFLNHDKDDCIYVHSQNPPITRLRANPKPEYMDQINLTKKKKEEYNAIITKYRNELRSLGIMGEFVINNFPADTDVKEEWFDLIEEVTSSKIDLCINPKTELWKYLEEHYPGILKSRSYA